MEGSVTTLEEACGTPTGLPRELWLSIFEHFVESHMFSQSRTQRKASLQALQRLQYVCKLWRVSVSVSRMITWLTYTEQGMIKPLLYRYVDLDLSIWKNSTKKIFYHFGLEKTLASSKASWIHTLGVSIPTHIMPDEPTLTRLRKDSIALITRSTALRELRLNFLLDREDFTTIACCHGPALTKLSVFLTWNLLPLLQHFPLLKDLQLRFYNKNRNDSELQDLFRRDSLNPMKFARGVTLSNLRELVAFVNLANIRLVKYLTNCNLPKLRKTVFTGGYRTLPDDYTRISTLVLRHGLGLEHFGFGGEHVREDSEMPNILFHMPRLSTLEVSTPFRYGLHLRDLPVSVTQIILCGFDRHRDYRGNPDFLSAARTFQQLVGVVRRLPPRHSLSSFRMVREYGADEPWLWEDAMKYANTGRYWIGKRFRKPVIRLEQLGIDLLDEHGVALASVVRELDRVQSLTRCPTCNTLPQNQPTRTMGLEMV